MGATQRENKNETHIKMDVNVFLKFDKPLNPRIVATPNAVARVYS
jgi:hypothetical protein